MNNKCVLDDESSLQFIELDNVEKSRQLQWPIEKFDIIFIIIYFIIFHFQNIYWHIN